MDLSKALDAMPHDLLLAKLRAYGMSESALKALRAYFLNRKQRVKISDTYSDWDTIIKGIPQGSILGPILFTVHMNFCAHVGIKITIDQKLIKYVVNIHEMIRS